MTQHSLITRFDIWQCDGRDLSFFSIMQFDNEQPSGYLESFRFSITPELREMGHPFIGSIQYNKGEKAIIHGFFERL